MLRSESMLNAIALFFFDGCSFRVDILECIIQKLVSLRNIIRKVPVLTASHLVPLEILVLLFPVHL